MCRWSSHIELLHSRLGWHVCVVGSADGLVESGRIVLMCYHSIRGMDKCTSRIL
jgi:hypothetical protein